MQNVEPSVRLLKELAPLIVVENALFTPLR